MGAKRPRQAKEGSRAVAAALALVALAACRHRPTERERTLAARRDRLQEMRQRVERGEHLSWTDGESARQMCAGSDFPELAADCAWLDARLPRRPTPPSAANVEREYRLRQLRDARARLERGETVSEGEVTQLRYACAHDTSLREECDAFIKLISRVSLPKQ